MFKERLKTHHSAMADAKAYALGPRPITTFLNTVDQEDTDAIATIYIHVPFCSKICSFCNMRRTLQKPIDTYHELIIAEIEAYSRLAKVKQMKFDAIYFGGGTPTTLSVEALRSILRALKQNFNLTDEVEITIETTVTELTDDRLVMFKEEGVNRFSVGIQTFNDGGRMQMGRVGSGAAAYAKLKQVKDMGFKTVSMDLIYNYPGQTKEDLIEDLQKIVELGLDGFSMYSLINMKETHIDEAQSLAQDKQFFDLIASYMEEQGYRFLELTKMVREDQYKYVMNRHKGAATLPLGAGAGGNIDGLMLMNEINLDKYKETIENFESRSGMLFDKGYRRLTLFKGAIQTGYLPESITKSDDIECKNFVKSLIERGYVKDHTASYQFTSEGIFWGNNISRSLYDLIK